MKVLKVVSIYGAVVCIPLGRVDSFSRGYWQPVKVEEIEACGAELNPDKPFRCGNSLPCPDHDRPPSWQERYEREARHRAKLLKAFTSQEVLDVVGDPPEGTDGRKAGVIMAKLFREGLVRKLGYTTATHRSRHGAPVRMWIGVKRTVDGNWEWDGKRWTPAD